MQEALGYLLSAHGIYPWGVLVIGQPEIEEINSLIDCGINHASFIASETEEARAIASQTKRINGVIVIDGSSPLYRNSLKNLNAKDHLALCDNDPVSLISRRTKRSYNVLILTGFVRGAYRIEIAKNPDIEAVCVRQSCESSEIVEYIVAFENLGFNLGFYTKSLDGRACAVFIRSHRTEALFRNNHFDGVDVALHKTARQSSVSQHSTQHDASGPVSGLRSGRFNFHTDFEDCPWWEVDLGSAIPVSQIVVFNRLDAGVFRSRTLKVLVRDVQNQLHIVHDRAGKLFGGVDGRPVVISCYQMPITGVRVQLAETQYLHLDAVEVYSTVPSGHLDETFQARQAPSLENATL